MIVGYGNKTYKMKSISVFFDETDLDYDQDFEEDLTRVERDGFVSVRR
jgi:hypothetical protein